MTACGDREKEKEMAGRGRRGPGRGRPRGGPPRSRQPQHDYPGTPSFVCLSGRMALNKRCSVLDIAVHVGGREVGWDI